MKNLGTIRKKRGLTQFQLYELTGISQQCIHNYETGKSMPSCNSLVIFAKALNTSTDYLLELTTNDAPANHIRESELNPDEAFIVSEMRNNVDAYTEFIINSTNSFKKLQSK